MAAIAREINQSETTFITTATRADALWRLRSFTPDGSEVTGAGHNSLGAWWWLAATGQAVPGEHRQQLGDASLPLHIDGETGRPERVTLTQGPLTIARPEVPATTLADALGLKATAFDPARPPVTGSPAHRLTGSPAHRLNGHLLVAMSDRDTLNAARPEPARLRDVLADAGAQGCCLYCLDPIEPGHHAQARFFNPTVGIAEDPATGRPPAPSRPTSSSKAAYPTNPQSASSKATDSDARACWRSRSSPPESG